MTGPLAIELVSACAMPFFETLVTLENSVMSMNEKQSSDDLVEVTDFFGGERNSPEPLAQPECCDCSKCEGGNNATNNLTQPSCMPSHG